MIIKENKSLLEKILQTNLLPLAFIGDSVHTLCVREKCLLKLNDKIGNYHSSASYFCKASHQAKVLQNLIPLLDDKESEIVRRGRNIKTKHHAKNATSSEYSYATAFEILIGYLYLNGDQNRFDQIIEFSLQK